MAAPHAPAETQPQPPNPTFYWELGATQREQLRTTNHILEDEGYLAHEINRGRRLIELGDNYEALPDVRPGWTPPSQAHGFADPVAAILQVAVDNGHDPIDICNAALVTQRSVRNHAASAASQRPNPPAADTVRPRYEPKVGSAIDDEPSDPSAEMDAT